MSDFEQRISIDQVRVGLYIRLETWMDHPFMFSSFKIRNEKQLQVLRSLGLTEVLYVREKSDLPPLPPPPEDKAPEPPPPPDPEIEAMWAAKKERRAKLADQREALGRCEKKFTTGMSTVKSVLRNLFSRPAESIAQAQELVSDMVDSLLEEKDVVLHLMSAKAGDEGAYYHALNVTMLSLILGKEANLNPDEMRALGLGTLLHDMGKEKVPSQILLKKTVWTPAERNFYQQHVLYGIEMAQKVPEMNAIALEVVAMHHELLDGTGFPGQLKGERIGRFARIACIANTFDNYCNRVNIAESMTPAEAIVHMFRKEKNKYDPDLIQFFVRCMGVYPPGSLVQLNTGQIGLVVSVTPGQLLHPTLLIYDAEVPKEEALWLDLSTDRSLSVVKTLRPNELDKAVYEYLNPRTRVSYYADSSSSGSTRQGA